MEINVVNANHERVSSMIEKLLMERHPHACSCPRCISDITALALNFLPPHYYVERGEDRVAGSPWLMVETAVEEAINIVREHPSHCGRR
jgi:hypothetical protein